MTPREIHIAHGLSAPGSLRQALNLSPDSILANQDVLSCGPLLPFRSLEEWRMQREAYWGDIYQGEISFNESERDLPTNSSIVCEAESLLLWIAKGLAEQLLLCWTMQFLRVLNIEPQRLKVIQFERYSDCDMEIWGLGSLNPTELRAHPTPQQLTTDALKELDETWSAVTAAEPTGLLALLSKPSRSLPYLRSSLRSILGRFPNRDTGLNYWEMELLKNVSDRGPRAIRVIAYTLSTVIEDLVGDAWLFDRLSRLADSSLPHPLLNFTGNPASMRECDFTLTDAGRSVLAGRANHVTLNGINDWVGGVHLDSASGNIWFHHGDSLVRISE
jgi:uncharacterized protein DUF1835